jgi:hypothetical protein
MIPTITIRAALEDPNLLGLTGESWLPWRVLLIAALGEPLTDEERPTFTLLTGREREPLQRCAELALAIGRRGGKTRALAALAVYVAALCRHEGLALGETGTALVLAPDARQSALSIDYAEGILQASPVLRSRLVGRSGDILTLQNSTEIAARAASPQNIRGMSTILVVADEIAWFVGERDTEILRAIAPSLLTTKGLLVKSSSPRARNGELFRTYEKNFGPDGDPKILVAQAASQMMNKTLDQDAIAAAYAQDPVGSAAEYGAEFRNAADPFMDPEALEACIQPKWELPWDATRDHKGFIDCASGAAKDSTALAIGSMTEEGIPEVAVLMEWQPPFSPSEVIAQAAKKLREYDVFEVSGDKYADAFVKELFSEHGIEYVPSTETKSSLYANLLSRVNSQRVLLLKHERCTEQLLGLVRKPSRAGRDSIDHQDGGVDDVANACAGLIASLTSASDFLDYAEWVGGPPPIPDDSSPAHGNAWASVFPILGQI